MSNEQNNNAEMEKVAEALFNNVYLPAFIKRCSAKGIEFSSEDELVAALQNAAILKSAEEQNKQEKSASLHKTANSLLRTQLLGEDTAAQTKKASDEQQLNEFIAELYSAAE